jgi:hypothetical protein
VVPADIIRAQKEYIDTVAGKIEKLAQKKSTPEAVENLVTPLLNPFKISNSLQQKYTRRLRYGLRHYYARHFRPSGSGSPDE